MRMMKGLIRTVRGDIAPEELGFCQSHEHILLRKSHSYEINPILWQDDPLLSGQELVSYAGRGGKAVVDAQPVGCGRMAQELLQISETSDVHIIASTGFHKLIFYPEEHWIHTITTEDFTRLLLEELTEGMYEDGDESPVSFRTKVRAGQIKTAVDAEGLTPRYRRIFQAAAGAGKISGAPVMIHIEKGADPLEVLAFFTENNISASQLIFCHLDRACYDPAVHETVARSGAYLEYDTIGRFKYHSDRREAEIFLHMMNSGFEKQILFSLDTTRARLGAYGGEISLLYIMDTFLPVLKENGITPEQIHLISTANPAAAFAWR